MSNAVQTLEQHLQAQLGTVMVGMQDVIRALTVALVGRGHVLLQGAPGLGKTLLGKTFAAALGGVFKRVQGTSDLMPADITGIDIYDSDARQFQFRPGPVFTDVLLVDEINRAGPKTQSALLEAMEERQVTVERRNHPLPENFLVIATQNPRDFEGTYPLPESQLDRFMLRIDLNYPATQDELAILERYGKVNAHAGVLPVESVSSAMVDEARVAVNAVHVAPELARYAVDLASASRSHAHIGLGLSTRGVLALMRGARIAAAIRGAEFVSPDDLKEIATAVIAHRLVLAPEALLEGLSERSLVQRLLEQTPVPR
jgi:MoxR-like ATPase